MTAPRLIGVIDIGKTNVKFAVVDLSTRSEIAVRKCPNTVLTDGPYPHFDIEGIWEFLCEAIRDFNTELRLDALSVTTHGACAALVDAEGNLAMPVLDYEFAGPDRLDTAYEQARPEFSESFTPTLPGGLILGKQLFWLAQTYPEQFARAQWILTYPQYWSFRLTGVAASEITSLGCHTDLWDFDLDLFSSLVLRQGWIEKLPDVQPAFEVLGPVKAELAAALGLDHAIPVHSGIHDSNASLLPHVLSRKPPFAVVSTGTWVIVAAPGGDLAHLDPRRDTLANIDALGHHVPSARFMGGREFSMLTNGETRSPDRAARENVLDACIYLLPSVVPESGPFPHREARWSQSPESMSDDERYLVVSYYLAMMTAECLELAGAEGEIVVEGPFAANADFCSMLAAATSRPVLASTSSATGTSIGAALLADMHGHAVPAADTRVEDDNRLLRRYANAWRLALAGA